MRVRQGGYAPPPVILANDIYICQLPYAHIFHELTEGYRELTEGLEGYHTLTTTHNHPYVKPSRPNMGCFYQLVSSSESLGVV